MPLPPPTSAWHRHQADSTGEATATSSSSPSAAPAVLSSMGPPKQAGTYSSSAAGGGAGLLSARGVKARSSSNNGGSGRRVRIAALDVGRDDDDDDDDEDVSAPPPAPSPLPHHHHQPFLPTLPPLVHAPAPVLGRTVAHAATGAPSGRDVARLRGLVDEVTRLVAAGATYATLYDGLKARADASMVKQVVDANPAIAAYLKNPATAITVFVPSNAVG